MTTLHLDLTDEQMRTLQAMDAQHRASVQATAILAAAIEKYGRVQAETPRPTFRRCGGLRLAGR